MKNKDMEDLFRERFNNEEAPISEKVWENIKKSLPPEEPVKVPFILYYIYGLTAIGLSIVAVSVYNKYSQEKTNLRAGIISSSSSHVEAESNPIFKEEKSENKSVRVTNNGEIKFDRSENLRTKDKMDNHQVDNILKSDELSAPVHFRIEKDSKGYILVPGEDEAFKNSQGTNSDGEKFMSLYHSSTEEELGLVLKNNASIEKGSDLNKIENSLIERSGEIFISSKDSNQMSIEDGLINSNLNRKDSVLTGEGKIIVLDRDAKKQVTDSVLSNAAKGKKNGNQKKKERKEIFTQPISIDVYGSPLISYRTISGPSNIKSELNTNEKARINLGAGVKVSFSLNDKWKIGLGLNYSSFGERYKLGKDYYKETTAYFGYYQQDSTGAFIVKTDSSKYMQKYNVKSKNNYYRYVGVPIYFTRVLSEGKVGIALTAGASINFLTKAYTSRVRSVTDTVITIIEESSQNQGSPFRKITASAFLTSNFSYEINSSWKIIIDPGLTYFITSTYKSDYPINRHLFAFQVLAGLRYTLKK